MGSLQKKRIPRLQSWGVVNPEEYQKILESKPDKNLQKAMENYKKSSAKYVEDPKEIRKILGEWARKD